jgi:hypothetical protein
MECIGLLVVAADGEGKQSFVAQVACAFFRSRRGEREPERLLRPAMASWPPRSVQIPCFLADSAMAAALGFGTLVAASARHRGVFASPFACHCMCPSLRVCIHRPRLPIAICAGGAWLRFARVE